jgi:hypothetical protein
MNVALWAVQGLLAVVPWSGRDESIRLRKVQRDVGKGRTCLKTIHTFGAVGRRLIAALFLISALGKIATHPDEFLVHLYHLNPDPIVNILHEQAAFIGRTLAQLLAALKQGVPNFVQLIVDSVDIAVD